MGAFDLRAAAREALVTHGFRPDFPAEVLDEVAQLPEARPARDGIARDLRALPWSSIDNRDSRDLDQVEWVEALEGDRIRLLVGVADVDSRVRKDGAIDAHAGVNTTSIYVAGGVFPMLPERLSNDLTSLNPGEDRHAVVVDLVLDAEGKVVAEVIYRAHVRNHARFDYDSVGAWLADDTPVPEAVAAADLEGQLRLQDAATQRLVAFRRRTGVLDLDTGEARPVVAEGRLVDMEVVPTNRARDIIENFMVAANSALARYLRDSGLASIRRVVRTPRRWDRIVEVAAEMGETLPPEPSAPALSEFLIRRRGADPEHFPDLSLTVVKLLGSGEYVLEHRQGDGRGEGHFALSAAEYTHGTAPNRRYADLVTQRLAKAAGAGVPSPYADEELGEIARRCTEQEDAARKVERTMRKKAAAVLMAERIGERFNAIVTGASSKGTYVRLLRPAVEGRVVKGERGLDVGDTVKVTLLSADPNIGHIDFAGPGGDVGRKLARSREKKGAAARLLTKVGDSFTAIVTAASPKGTYVRLPREGVDGRVVRGARGLVAGQSLRVTLLSVDSVHGFIDFENPAGLPPHKHDRWERKRSAAKALRTRVGQAFDAVVTANGPKATYVRVLRPEAEGRLVRGGQGLAVGAAVRVRLVSADPRRGFIDFVPA